MFPVNTTATKNINFIEIPDHFWKFAKIFYKLSKFSKTLSEDFPKTSCDLTIIFRRFPKTAKNFPSISKEFPNVAEGFRKIFIPLQEHFRSNWKFSGKLRSRMKRLNCEVLRKKLFSCNHSEASIYSRCGIKYVIKRQPPLHNEMVFPSSYEFTSGVWYRN